MVIEIGVDELKKKIQRTHVSVYFITFLKMHVVEGQCCFSGDRIKIT